MNIFDIVIESVMQSFSSPEELFQWMKSNIRYSNFTNLKAPDEVYNSKSGSCHDQVMFELYHLRKMKLHPKALFFIEYHPDKSNGGITHSFVYYQYKGKFYWFENAWGEMEGIHQFDSVKEIKDKIRLLHDQRKFGNSIQFPKLKFANFGKHTPGESLSELVSKILN